MRPVSKLDKKFDLRNGANQQNQHFDPEIFAPSFLVELVAVVILNSLAHLLAIIVDHNFLFLFSLASDENAEPPILVNLSEYNTTGTCDGQPQHHVAVVLVRVRLPAVTVVGILIYQIDFLQVLGDIRIIVPGHEVVHVELVLDDRQEQASTREYCDKIIVKSPLVE